VVRVANGDPVPNNCAELDPREWIESNDEEEVFGKRWVSNRAASKDRASTL
jgi:hypothetical protein